MSAENAKPKRSAASRLVEDASSTLVTRILGMAIGLFTGIITARWLGPESRGIFSLVVLFPSTLVTLTKFGQSQASIYFIRRQKIDPSRVASNVATFAVGVGVVAIGVVVLAREWLVATVLNGVPVWALLCIVPLIPVLLLESYLYGVLQATDRFRTYNLRIIGDNVMTLLSMAVALVVLDLGLVGALGVVIAVRAVMILWVLRTVNIETPLRPAFDRGLFRQMIRYGLKSHVQIIASHFHVRAAMYLVAYYLDPAQVAFYSIGARLAERILYVPQSLGLALFPRLASADVERVHSMTATAVRQTLVMTVSLAAFVTVVGPWAIVIAYGDAYAAAAVPLRIVCWGIVMMSMYVLLSRNFTSRDRQQINIIAAYLALGGNLLLNVYLVPRYGIAGSAWATTCSYSVAALVLLAFFLRESGLPLRQVLLIQPSDLALWRRLAGEGLSQLRAGRASGPPAPR